MKLAVICLVLPLAVGTAAAETMRHVPPAEAEAGTAIELVAEASATTPTLVAHVRTSGATTFAPIELVRRDELHWIAIVPATSVVPPGLEYFIDAGGAPVFASPESPHTVSVRLTDEAERKGRDMLRSNARRSRIHVMGEWVDYGTRTMGTQQLPDHYYRLDGDFAYRLWAYPLEELRVGYTRLIGETASTACPTGSTTCEAGFKVGGWFELGLAPIEGIRFDGRMMVMATGNGFGIGGRGEARLGERDASHVAIGVESIQDIGTSGFFRLGWGTVPTFPMTATVEITNLPAPDRSTGVRLYYDLAHDFGQGVRVGVRVGYAARVQTVAGFTGGLGATVDF